MTYSADSFLRGIRPAETRVPHQRFELWTRSLRPHGANSAEWRVAMRRTENPAPTALRGRRRAGRAQDEHIIDPYRQTRKLSEPSYCGQCGAVYRAGRWKWGPRPEGAQEALCQACRRINDKYPAG